MDDLTSPIRKLNYRDRLVVGGLALFLAAGVIAGVHPLSDVQFRRSEDFQHMGLRPVGRMGTYTVAITGETISASGTMDAIHTSNWS